MAATGCVCVSCTDSAMLLVCIFLFASSGRPPFAGFDRGLHHRHTAPGRNGESFSFA